MLQQEKVEKVEKAEKILSTVKFVFVLESRAHEVLSHPDLRSTMCWPLAHEMALSCKVS